MLLIYLSNMERFTEKVSNYLSNNSSGKIKVYWFHTKTCPYCIKMKNSWESLTKLYKKDPKRKKKFDLVKIDVGENSYSDIVSNYDSRIKQNHSGNGVPNIVMIMPDGKDYIYDGDRSATHIDYWIRIESGNRIV